MLHKIIGICKKHAKQILTKRRRNRRANKWIATTTQRLNRLSIRQNLTLEEKASISTTWSEISKLFKINTLFFEFYKSATGHFDVRNIPDDFYYTVIDPAFNDWARAAYIDNKALYPVLFAHLKQPFLIAIRQNGFWSINGTDLVSQERVINHLTNMSDYFIKTAENSEGGHGISYFGTEPVSPMTLHELFDNIPQDIVIQGGLKQSAALATLNSSSVNTIRIVTFLRHDGSVKICSSVIRMGVAGAKVDNASSGGIVAGICADGRLKSVAYSADGHCFNTHPTSNIKFDSCIIPSFNRIIQLVTNEAKHLPHYRLISWDIAVDDQDEPVFIEANLKYGELEFHQLTNGPIFGDETFQIISEALSHGLPYLHW